MRTYRLLDRPIITPDLDPTIGVNIQGPSMIRVPDWIRDRLGAYYLYFAGVCYSIAVYKNYNRHSSINKEKTKELSRFRSLLIIIISLLPLFWCQALALAVGGPPSVRRTSVANVTLGRPAPTISPRSRSPDAKRNDCSLNRGGSLHFRLRSMLDTKHHQEPARWTM